MACKCEKISTILKCLDCYGTIVVKHTRAKDPLVVAVNQGRKCPNCRNSSFEIFDK